MVWQASVLVMLGDIFRLGVEQLVSRQLGLAELLGLSRLGSVR